MERSEAKNFFLQKTGLSGRRLEKVVERALGNKVEYADLYFEHTVQEAVSREEGRIKKVIGNISHGAGVRAVAGEKTGYAYTDEVNLKTLDTAASAAKYIAKYGPEHGSFLPVKVGGEARNIYGLPRSPVDVALAEKARLLQLVDEECRAYDPRIREVIATFAVEEKRVLVVRRDGWTVGDVRPLIRLSVQCVAQEGNRREIGSYGGGGRLDISYFFEDNHYKSFAREAARSAIVNLSAIDAPAGLMAVVLGPGWPGILLHEAIGHGLEGDFNRQRLSAFTDKIGRRVAADICTVVDDGTIPNRRGSLNVDDEGTPTQRNILIERGILVRYMQDLLNAKLMGMEPTGNGRRESYKFAPMPRMTNTFMLPGDLSPKDIIRSVKNGIYAKQFGGGQVDITNGNFVFSATESYLIEGGKITQPIRGVTLIGHGPTALTKVVMVGNDLELDSGVGTCGKDGQSVPVGVGLPTIKISEMTVGGTRI